MGLLCAQQERWRGGWLIPHVCEACPVDGRELVQCRGAGYQHHQFALLAQVSASPQKDTHDQNLSPKSHLFVHRYPLLPTCAVPQRHSFVYQSTDVTYANIQIHSISSNASAPASNTDGWDIYRSSYVTIRDSVVINGDDWYDPSLPLIWESRLISGLQCKFQAELDVYDGREHVLQVSTLLRGRIEEADQGSKVGLTVSRLGRWDNITARVSGKRRACSAADSDPSARSLPLDPLLFNPVLCRPSSRSYRLARRSRHRRGRVRPKHIHDQRPERGAHQSVRRIKRYQFAIRRRERVCLQRHL